MGDGVFALIGEIITVKIVLPYLHLCEMSLFAMMSSCLVVRRTLALCSSLDNGRNHWQAGGDAGRPVVPEQASLFGIS
jgi:hypothetical protein